MEGSFSKPAPESWSFFEQDMANTAQSANVEKVLAKFFIFVIFGMYVVAG